MSSLESSPKMPRTPSMSWIRVGLVLFLVILQGSDCFKVLFLYPYPTKSHFGSPKALAEELARRGHEVTVASPYPPEKAAYRQITLDTTPILAQLEERGSDCFRVLFMCAFPTRSHFGSYKALAEELARRGHDVTLVSHFPQEEVNYKKIKLDSTDVTHKGANFTEFHGTSQLLTRAFWFLMFNSWMESMASSKELKDLAASNEHYDVILGEVSFFSPLILAFGYKFKAPVIDLSPAAPFTHVASYMGNPFSFSYIPDTMVPVSDEMSFKERVENTVNGLWDLAWYNWYMLPGQDKMARRHFSFPGVESMPSLRELTKNVSLSLVNSHFSIGYSRPFAPNFVEVAGMHLKPPKKLPQDLQNFMDKAEHGVVYLSFGTVVKAAMLGEVRTMAIAHALKRLRQRVVIKLDTPSKLFQDADNIMVLDWAPQQEILAHPKLVLFVTHGGYNSLIESTHAGVPVLGIPVFADQFRNIRFYEARGIGKGLNLDTFTGEQLYETMVHIINTPSFRENARQISSRTRDRPLSALDTAVYWVEYVVRHKGAPHLRPTSVNLPLYQYLLLDVISFMFLVVLVTYKLIRKLCCTRSKAVSPKKEKVQEKIN